MVRTPAAAAALLGGSATLRHRVRTYLDVHDAITRGIPGSTLAVLLKQVQALPEHEVLNAIGVSARSARRHRRHAREALNAGQSGRVWTFAEVLARATAVFGGQGAAERWLATPAIGLEGRRPIDLLSSPVGVGLVEQLLGRIALGVYS